VRTFCGQDGGSSDADVRTFGDKGGGWVMFEPVRTFFVKEGGGQFSRFYADVFYRRPLSLLQLISLNQFLSHLFHLRLVFLDFRPLVDNSTDHVRCDVYTK